MTTTTTMTKPDDDASPLEAHRAIARELHLAAQRAYALGGALALAAPVVVLALAWWAGQLLTPLPYLAALTACLVTLFFARRAINAHLHRLRARLQGYCQSNAVESEALIHHFARHQHYAMLEALRPATRRPRSS